MRNLLVFGKVAIIPTLFIIACNIAIFVYLYFFFIEGFPFFKIAGVSVQNCAALSYATMRAIYITYYPVAIIMMLFIVCCTILIGTVNLKVAVIHLCIAFLIYSPFFALVSSPQLFLLPRLVPAACSTAPASLFLVGYAVLMSLLTYLFFGTAPFLMKIALRRNQHND